MDLRPGPEEHLLRGIANGLITMIVGALIVIGAILLASYFGII
jgi:hypothetical protein